jgi:Bifunctional DNA primase/polymerase, N-terminal
VLNAATDPALVTTWWTQLPEANIGIATGRNSNLVVLDIDGAKGEAFLAFVEAKHGPLPPTLEVKTGKGRHLYFRYPDNVAKVKSVAHKETGLDVRADGGYVVGPPSIHASGHRYVVVPNAPDDLPECPAWIVVYANGEMAARTRKETPPTPYSEDEEARLRSSPKASGS